MTTFFVSLARVAQFFLATKYIKSNICLFHRNNKHKPSSESPPLIPPRSSSLLSPPFFTVNFKSTTSNPPQVVDDDRHSVKTTATNIDGILLSPKNNKTHVAFFPYFMLVAFEGGGLLRAFFLLASYPLLCIMPLQYQIKIMTFISFFGLKLRNMNVVGRAVLPKFYSQHLDVQPLQDSKTWPKAIVTTIPKVMIETYFKEYLGIQYVIGSELGQFESAKRYNGLIHEPNFHLGLHYEGPKHMDSGPVKVNPVIFHDGRLAFLPTPIATLVMFLWLPIGVILAVVRILNGCIFPYHVSYAINSWTGLQKRVQGLDLSRSERNKGVLYVCNHRTLLDPVMLSIVTRKPLTAVTYSLSTFSEIIAPIRTVSLTRDRTNDRATIHKLLTQGDLVVCPEGTTCREPYLLRFSPLFAEVTDEIVLVAMDTKVSMFYGTTASGLKWLDSIFFLMNPTPRYNIRILGKLPRELTCGGGKSNIEVANYAQKKLADALGFTCTNLTRKDKYLTLVGDKGVVAPLKLKRRELEVE